MIKTTKTIYDEVEASDGARILVMRLWPRGIKKEKIDLWIKELGAEPELIKKWKGGEISWAEFSKEYRKSLKGKKEILRALALESKKKSITLLCSCKDEKHCHRYLLRKAIEKEV
jgi:uncharacterized protein YeaO (DUF488 family)